MESVWSVIKGIVIAAWGYITWFFGGFDGVFITLCTFAVVDYLSGVIAAIIEKQLSSQIGAKGIARKFLMFLIVGIASILDSYVLGGNSPIREIVIVFYIANEGISIIENSARLGLPIPEKLLSILKQLKSKGDDEDAGV